MFRITDNEKTKIVNIPSELAENMGVFKDMMNTVLAVQDDSEPVRALRLRE